MQNKIPSVFRLFRTKPPKGFHYMPRHYDPNKEEMEKRIERIKSEMGLDAQEEEKARREISFRSKMNARWDTTDRSKAIGQANMRLVIILLVLCGLFFAVYMYLDRF